MKVLLVINGYPPDNTRVPGHSHGALPSVLRLLGLRSQYSAWRRSISSSYWVGLDTMDGGDW